jgi:DNA-binding NtrC family response regulator
MMPNPSGVTAAQTEGSNVLYPPAYHAPPPVAAPASPAMAESDVDDVEAGDEIAVEAVAPANQDGRRLAEVAREAAMTAERAVISDTLRQVHWNRRKAAQLLGVSYKTLLNKIKETGIERP